MKKKLFFGALLLLIIASYCYSHRDMFRDKDTVSFANTPADVQKRIKIAAFTNDPARVEFKGGEWYGDGQPAIVVYDGQTNHGLAKDYKHVQFFITVGEKFFSNQLSFDKPDTKDAYDIQLQLMPKDSSYAIHGEAFHLGDKFLTFDERTMQPLAEGVKISYLKSE